MIAYILVWFLRTTVIDSTERKIGSNYPFSAFLLLTVSQLAATSIPNLRASTTTYVSST